MDTSPPTDAAAEGATRWPSSPDDARRRQQRRNLITAAAVLLALALLGTWIYTEVRRSLIALLSDSLTTILEADVTALGLWMRNERDSVTSWAGSPALREGIANLVKLGPEAVYTDEGHGHRQQIDRIMSGLLAAESAVGYLVVNPAWRIIAANEASLVGRLMTAGGSELTSRVLGGQSVVTAPFRLKDFFYADIAQAELPVMVKASPVYDDEGSAFAALIVAIRPDEFSHILSIARFGKTGDTYAFGPNGWILSESRHVQELERLGLVPDESGRSIFAFQIRDPGGDLGRGYQPERPMEQRPFTRMAASALAGETGIDLEGYRDYRGVEVMGAWRWLDEYGFGVATEVNRNDVLAVLRPIIAASVGLFTIVVIAAAALLANMLIVQRLRRRIEMTRLGQYSLLEKIGEGGAGEVYLARHALLRRPTAVKFLRPELMSEDSIKRFEQEVQRTSQLQHPNTVAIYDYGRTPENVFYYAMEYLEGYTLARLIEIDGRLPAARVVHIVREVCLALREAHDAGLCHLDIKPLNILVCAQGGEYDVVKVVDFGLVRHVGTEQDPASATALIPGTLPYIAPERLQPGAAIDSRADIYSLGTVAFNLLTGRQTFAGETAADLCYKVCHEAPPAPSALVDGGIPAELEAVILSMLATRPEARPQTIREVLAALDDMARRHSWTRTMAKAWWDAHPAARRPLSANPAPISRFDGAQERAR